MTISLTVFGRNSCSRKSFHAFPILSHTAVEECRSNKISWTSIPQRSQDARSRPFHNECNVLCVECLPTLVLRAPAQNLSQHMKVAQATIGSVGWISVAPDCGTQNLEKLATSMRAPHLLLLLPSIARLGQSHPHYLPTSDQATIYLKQFKTSQKPQLKAPWKLTICARPAKTFPKYPIQLRSRLSAISFFRSRQFVQKMARHSYGFQWDILRHSVRASNII